MKHRKTFRGAFQRKLTKFGDLITFDYVDNRRIAEQDYGDDKTIFVIRDRYTGILQSYPSARKDTDAVIRAVKQFMGRRKIREAYSDDAPQFDKAMKILKIPMETSLAGKTKHKLACRKELTNSCSWQRRHVYLKQGIPPCFWMYAIRCGSHLLNIEPNDDEVSSWCNFMERIQRKDEYPLVPSCTSNPVVHVNENNNTNLILWESRSVSLDTPLVPGLHWSRSTGYGRYVDWSKQNLAYDAEKPIAKLRTPHYTERVN